MALSRLLASCVALLAPASVLAEAGPESASDFTRLWTGWSAASREALRIETRGLERVRRDIATAGADRLRELRQQGRALGERVGEIVRRGDCEEGERIARGAGDFALVAAVRSHCRSDDVD